MRQGRSLSYPSSASSKPSGDREDRTGEEARASVVNLGGTRMDVKISRVAIACTQPLFRQGLISLMRGRWPEWLFLDGDNADNIADDVGQDMSTTLLIIELDLPGLPGLRRLSQLQAENPDLLVVVLGDARRFDIIWQCIEMGARAYLDKTAPAGQFIQAVETILANGVFAPAIPGATRFRCSLAIDFRPSYVLERDQPLPAAFTGRQREVFLLLVEGCSTKSIARRLGLSVGTVKVHLGGIYRLLGAHSRIEALAKARSCGSHPMFPVGQPQLEPEMHSPPRFDLNWCTT